MRIVHQAGQVMVMTAATTATVETVETMTVMVQTQVVEATTSLAQQAALSQTTTIPTLGGSPQVQDINLAPQPQEEIMLLQNLIITLALILNLIHNVALSQPKLAVIFLAQHSRIKLKRWSNN